MWKHSSITIVSSSSRWCSAPGAKFRSDSCTTASTELSYIVVCRSLEPLYDRLTLEIPPFHNHRRPITIDILFPSDNIENQDGDPCHENDARDANHRVTTLSESNTLRPGCVTFGQACVETAIQASADNEQDNPNDAESYWPPEAKWFHIAPEIWWSRRVGRCVYSLHGDESGLSVFRCGLRSVVFGVGEEE